jgi:hypothetical protein
MATRSLVGIRNEDGTMTLIYVHHDGYPSGVGAALYQHYTTEPQVRALMNSGDHSTLDRAEPWEGAYGDGSDAVTTPDWPDSGQEWVYLWSGGEWFGAPYGWSPENPKPKVDLVPLYILLRRHPCLPWSA